MRRARLGNLASRGTASQALPNCARSRSNSASTSRLRCASSAARVSASCRRRCSSCRRCCSSCRRCCSSCRRCCSSCRRRRSSSRRCSSSIEVVIGVPSGRYGRKSRSSHASWSSHRKYRFKDALKIPPASSGSISMMVPTAFRRHPPKFYRAIHIGLMDKILRNPYIP